MHEIHLKNEYPKFCRNVNLLQRSPAAVRTNFWILSKCLFWHIRINGTKPELFAKNRESQRRWNEAAS